MRALGYTRVSTTEQGTNGNGLDAQRAAIVAECERRQWVLVDVIIDRGVSGKTLDRPGLHEALRRLRTGEADALVVARLDRLSRRNRDLAGLIEETRKTRTIGTGSTRKRVARWQLVPCDFPSLDTTTAAGKMMAAQLGVFAQFERELASERTKAALARLKARGVKLGTHGWKTRPMASWSVPERIVRRIVRARD